jgi:hypothetical protein
MKKLSDKSKNTLRRLKLKAEDKKYRMPSIKDIKALLDELGIENDLHETTNVVEYRNAGCRYVNSRHDGKEGYGLEVYVDGVRVMSLDTSDSYYSWNTRHLAYDLVKLITGK